MLPYTTCHLGLMDIADLRRLLTTVHWVITQGGWSVFVIVHLCRLAPEAGGVEVRAGLRLLSVLGYFERFWRSCNPNGVRRTAN
jgi:hypothetical protein